MSLVSLLFLLVYAPLFGQTERIQIQEVSELIGKQRELTLRYLDAKEYSYKSRNGEIESYALNKQSGYSDIHVAFKNSVLNVMSWNESTLYASVLISDAFSVGFAIVEEVSSSKAMVLKNGVSGQMLILFDHSEDGYIAITIGTVPKDKVHGFSPHKVEARTNSGIKYYCEGTETWVYSVQIVGDSAILKLYPGIANSKYRKPLTAIEVLRGQIKDDIVIIRASAEKAETLFRLGDGVLDILKNGGISNTFYECTYD